MAGPQVSTTSIPGLLRIDLDVRGDNRGWFKENWQRRTMVAAGLPDFGPVQQNMSFNTRRGVTRGIHAEPWDKLVSVATGRVFGAWVDLRPGEHFGRTYTTELGPETAVFVPRGVGNAFQTLTDGTVYSYLVNDHWSPTGQGLLHLRQPRGRDPGHRLADPAGGDRPVGGRPGPPAARRRGADAPEAGAGGRRLRPARPVPDGGVARGRRDRPPRTGPEPAGVGGRVRPLPVRGGGQRRRLHQGGRGRERPGPARGVDGQRRRGRRPGPRGPRAPLHPGAHLLRLRLRRPERDPRRARAVLPAGRVRPDQGGGRRAGRHLRTATTCCGPAG